MAIQGRDISNWDGASPDLTGLGFVICKAGQGINDAGDDFRYPDKFFDQHIRLAKAVGATPGAYHFLEHGNGAGQARIFANAVRSVGGPEGMLLAVDVERYGGNEQYAPDTGDFDAFHQALHREFPGHPLLVYSYYYFWHSSYHDDQVNCSLCHLWSAAYQSSPPQPYGGFPTVTLHQFSAQPYDQDRFYGTPTELAALTTSTQGDDMSAQDVQAITDHVDKLVSMLEYGDGPSVPNGGTHPGNLLNIARQVSALNGQLAGLASAVQQLAKVGGVDLAAVQAAADAGVKQAFADLGQAAAQ